MGSERARPFYVVVERGDRLILREIGADLRFGAKRVHILDAVPLVITGDKRLRATVSFDDAMHSSEYLVKGAIVEPKRFACFTKREGYNAFLFSYSVGVVVLLILRFAIKTSGDGLAERRSAS
jgi:hypothetical protein